jgi:hypothetical protein
MKKVFFSLLLTSMIAPYAFAGEAKVTWLEPEKYTDIRASNELGDGFKERVFTEFNAMFSKLAKKLPAGYQMEVTVTDLDLAGDVNGMYNRLGRDIRVIKELYWPRMSFSYILKNEKNELVASAKEDIKDMNFMTSIGIRSSGNSFDYEEKMLNDWFKAQQKMKKFPSNK